jgi:FAD/FMN-containing dehydrogenase
VSWLRAVAPEGPQDARTAGATGKVNCVVAMSPPSQGQIHTATRDEPETWHALNGGLGLMGVVTELVLQLTPPTNTVLRTALNQPDTDMPEKIMRMLKVRNTVVGSSCSQDAALGALLAAALAHNTTAGGTS